MRGPPPTSYAVTLNFNNLNSALENPIVGIVGSLDSKKKEIKFLSKMYKTTHTVRSIVV